MQNHSAGTVATLSGLRPFLELCSEDLEWLNGVIHAFVACSTRNGLPVCIVLLGLRFFTSSDLLEELLVCLINSGPPRKRFG